MIELGKKTPYEGKESALQVSVINALRQMGFMCIHIPNGGSRNKREAANLKKQGVLAGASDILIFTSQQLIHLPTQTYHNGIAIELKRKGGKLNPNQKEFLAQLEQKGWLCIVSYNADVVEYLQKNVRE